MRFEYFLRELWRVSRKLSAQKLKRILRSFFCFFCLFVFVYSVMNYSPYTCLLNTGTCVISTVTVPCVIGSSIQIGAESRRVWRESWCFEKRLLAARTLSYDTVCMIRRPQTHSRNIIALILNWNTLIANVRSTHANYKTVRIERRPRAVPAVGQCKLACCSSSRVHWLGSWPVFQYASCYN